jgi:hypothetical protein
MKYLLIKTSRGATLLETIIYIVLLSFLLSGFMRSVWDLQWQDLQLLDEIQDAYAA